MIRLSIIAAMTNDRVIGQNGKIPWHYPEDMRWFKERTMGSTVIMGRKTWESIGSQPLKGRTNIVVSKSLCDAENRQYIKIPCERNIHSWGLSDGHRIAFIPDLGMLELFNITKGDIWFIGGEQIYREALKLADTMFITRVPDKIEGDNLTYFPKYDERNWETTACLFTDTPDLYFMQYKRKK